MVGLMIWAQSYSKSHGKSHSKSLLTPPQLVDHRNITDSGVQSLDISRLVSAVSTLDKLPELSERIPEKF